jgi:hypothetical protein
MAGDGGFSVDASVRIEGENRAGLERLVRYCARGPLALERLHAPAGLEALSSPEARLTDRLPEPDRHGRGVLRLAPLELLKRLARLVPPPRIHRHRYLRIGLFISPLLISGGFFGGRRAAQAANRSPWCG